MLTKYTNGAEQEVTEVCRFANGAEVEADGVYKYTNGAEEEVWSSGLTIGGYTIGSFPSDDCSIYINERVTASVGEEVRMGFRLPSSVTEGTTYTIGFYILGNFTNPVISCEGVLNCDTTRMCDSAVCGFAFYNGDTYKSMRNIVGYDDSSTTITGRLSNYTQSGTFDKIVVRLSIYIDYTSFRSGLVQVSLRNLTIDGKKIKSKLKIGEEASYD